LNNPPKPIKELKKFLHDIAVRLHRNHDSFERTHFRVVSGATDYHVQTSITITHIALSPSIFGAIFRVEGWRYYSRTLSKTVALNFLLVVPQVSVEMTIVPDMIKVFKSTPALDENDFATLANGFKGYFLQGWMA
jgi:hypothetical protein